MKNIHPEFAYQSRELGIQIDDTLGDPPDRKNYDRVVNSLLGEYINGFGLDDVNMLSFALSGHLRFDDAAGLMAQSAQYEEGDAASVLKMVGCDDAQASAALAAVADDNPELARKAIITAFLYLNRKRWTDEDHSLEALQKDEGDIRTLDGHVAASLDGHWLYTGETDRRTGDGWVSVRDARDLRKVAEHRTHGIDPHQILVDPQGRLVIANGGIPRDAAGDKRNLERMNPELVLLNPENGEKLGAWSLRDKRLAPHHIAWNRPLANGPLLLGIGLQAEHDDPAQRRDAPLLAVWDGQKLGIPSQVVAEGYAGDVAAGPNGGFVLSAQRANRILLWQPHATGDLLTIGKVQNPCGLWPLQDAPGVAIGGGLGLARWHATEGPSMLRWPQGMSAGNHWALLV